MSESSPRMQWPYPTREDDPWYEFFQDYVNAADVSGYAGREDPSLIWTGGGTVSWDLGTETLSWTGTINVHSPIGARLIQIEANSLADIEDGEVIYVTLTRQPLENITASLVKAQQLPSNDNARSLAVRIGDVIYFRTGISLGDGSSSEGIAPEPGGGGAGSGKQSHTIIVGNALEGDTTDICDILDPGDGSGIAAALVATAGVNTPKDIWIRHGYYDLNLPGSPTAAFVIPDDVTVRGAGKRHTIIGGRVAGDLCTFALGTDSELWDIGIQYELLTGAGLSSYAGGVSMEAGLGGVCRRVGVDFNGSYTPTEAGYLDIAGAFSWRGQTTGPYVGRWHDCKASGPSITNLGAPGGFIGFYTDCDAKFPFYDVFLENCEASGFDAGFASMAPGGQGQGGAFPPSGRLVACKSNQPYVAGFYYYSGLGGFGGPITLDHCEGITTSFFQPAVIEMDCATSSVVGCIVRDIGSPNPTSRGIAMWNDDHVVSGNRVVGFEISIWSNGDNAVTGNNVDGDIDASSEDVVTGNRMTGGGSLLLTGSRISATGNVVEGSGGISASSGVYQDNVVSGNMVDSGDIDVDGDYCLVTGNRVRLGDINVTGDNNKVSGNMLVTGAVNDTGVGNVISDNI